MAEENYRRLCESRSRPPLVNVGSGEDLSIRELAQTIARVVGFDGRLVFDTSKPDGTPRKLMDSSRIAAMGWKPSIGLEPGIADVYRRFVAGDGDREGDGVLTRSA